MAERTPKVCPDCGEAHTTSYVRCRRCHLRSRGHACPGCGVRIGSRSEKCRACWLADQRGDGTCVECGASRTSGRLCNRCRYLARGSHPCADCGKMIGAAAELCLSCVKKGERHPGWRGGQNRPCVDCGVLVNKRSERCRSCANKGEHHPAWKGGRTVDKDGYVMVWIPDDDPMAVMRNDGGYVREHRLVVARSLGRPLTLDEEVHHVNGVKSDNRIGNLAAMSKDEHTRLHSLQRHAA